MDSLLEQSYKHLELVFVNDGATDNTVGIIEEYRSRLEMEGYIVKVVNKRNGGLASAVNCGLKHVSGQYLCWPDPDDVLTPDSVEKRLEFMESHPDVAIVRGELDVKSETTGKVVRRFEMECKGASIVPNALENCIMVTGGWYFAALSYMLRTSVLDEVIPGREIYVCRRGGQNWQLLIPVLAKYDLWHLPVDIGCYMLRAGSHYAKTQTSVLNRIRHTCLSEDVLLHTLSSVGTDIYEQFSERVINKYVEEGQKNIDDLVARIQAATKKSFIEKIERLNEKIRLLQSPEKTAKEMKRLRKRYRMEYLLSKITMGKKRLYHKQLKRSLREQIRESGEDS